MARFLKICALVCAAAALAPGWGCKGSGEKAGRKPPSQGAPYELVVVAGHGEWPGPAGDTVRAIFGERFPMLNRSEPLYDIIRVLPSGFRGLVARHHNVLIIETAADMPQTEMEILNDVWASPQTVVTVRSLSADSLSAFLGSRREEVLAAFEKGELMRDLAAAKGETPREIRELMEQKFGLSMDMPRGFSLRKASEDFLWISHEMPASSRGIIIYGYPFGGAGDFESEALVGRRDAFVRNVPGPLAGSHMVTNPELTELSREIIGGREWVILRGFWDVAGDFMGGPFAVYSTVDTAARRVVAIDFYVYSPDPSLSQRDAMKQLEHLIYSVRIE